MIALIQRVNAAHVQINNVIVSSINHGTLLFLGIEKQDNEQKAQRLLERVLSYRIFEDELGRMNRSLQDIKGDLLVVPQFTLAANTNRGTRPSFSSVAPPDLARQLFDYFIKEANRIYPKVQQGIFAADMEVSLVNHGPVTFWLNT